MTTDTLLRRGLERQGDDLLLTLDPAFQGLPATAHGGSVLAAFQMMADRAGRHEVRGLYRKRVPLGVPLRLLTADTGRGLTCRLLDGANATLVEGHVGPDDEGRRPPAPPAVGRAWPLPVSTTCFACGVENARGLQLQLGHDDAAVAGVWPPRDPLRATDGTLAPLALTTLLDEAAFWLGALSSGESGMTTDLAVTLNDRVPFGSPITVGGLRARVRPRHDDPRYWDTEVGAWDDRGQLVAGARITFVAMRGAARRLVAWLLKVNTPDVVRRVFPGYA